ncbi:MAG: protein translocase subunit SecD, partial [Nitrospirae bacterium]|nr:protein translocase subunit SecD [Nitrospirota bacterium]
SPVAAELPASIPVGQEDSFTTTFASKVPEDSEILFERITKPESGETVKRPFLIKKEALLTGDLLTEARVSIDSRYNEPYVSITFNAVGANLFADVTGKYVKKRLAIILDNNVYSAPVIQEKINGGNAQITGSFSMEEAKDLAIVLRAGALPAPVKMLQNLTVGPTLGADSITAGKMAGLGAIIMVIGFMLFYYRLSGVIANIALIINIFLLLGVMSLLKATLTLPGIAGIILAIGMAVDTNVLMFERMREEIRAGKTPRSAIDSGYDKAFFTIIDSHVTTLITAAVLFQYGTGPIKGFAVTLSIGVIINLFTSLIGTKSLFDLINHNKEIKNLSI